MSGWRNNYAFDASRVTVVGKPTRAQVDYLNHLAEATEWMIEEMLPDRSFRFNLTESRGRLIHPSAHGIGLEICENPRIDINKDFVLKPGMVVCVEPSVLSKTEGEMAIKEMVLISEKGTEILTKCPRRA
jgi:Xaa-Pro aminopeptidase